MQTIVQAALTTRVAVGPGWEGARVWVDAGLLMVGGPRLDGGTTVNGRRIARPTALAEGDALVMGAAEPWAPAPAATVFGQAIVIDEPPPKRRWFRRREAGKPTPDEGS